MPHYVNDLCIKCKYTDCVEVCPVDCFYEGEAILVIDPESCIDCEVCIAECPVNAIVNDSSVIDGKSVEEVIAANNEDLTADQLKMKQMAKFNAKYSKEWPNITEMKDPLPYHEEFKDNLNKIAYLGDNIEYTDK